MARCDELVSGYRRELELMGFPEARHHWQLAALLQAEGSIVIEFADVARSFTIVRAGGVHDITLSCREPEERLVEIVLEEIGHAVMCGPGKALAGTSRLSLLNDDRDEHLSRKFVLAWKLPFDLVFPRLEQQELVVEQSGCSDAEIEERYSYLWSGR